MVEYRSLESIDWLYSSINKSNAMADSSIHIYRDGKWFGPYTSEEKDRYFDEGKLLGSDFYWHKGMMLRRPLAVSYRVSSCGQWTGPYSREELDLNLSEGKLKKTDWFFPNEPPGGHGSIQNPMPMRLEWLSGTPFRYKKYLALLVLLPAIAFIYADDWLARIGLCLCVLVAVLIPILCILRKDRIDEEKVRNEMLEKPCPCESGGNFKDCCSIYWELTRMWEELCPCGNSSTYKDCCYEPPKRISSGKSDFDTWAGSQNDY
jgi:hypothetical protein